MVLKSPCIFLPDFTVLCVLHLPYAFGLGCFYITWCLQFLYCGEGALIMRIWEAHWVNGFFSPK